MVKPPGGALFPQGEPVTTPFGRPLLCVIVDAEEEFAWDTLPPPAETGTTAMRAQSRVHAILQHYGARPTYLATWPVMQDPAAAGLLREWQASGLCDVGAHLHPWVTPPFDGPSTPARSFPGNLPPALEREKLLRLIDSIQTRGCGTPAVYRAGRYGVGTHSAALLEQTGFQVDASVIPRTSYAAIGGPDFTAFDAMPFWFGQQRRLLELPVTRALVGWAADGAADLHSLTETPLARRLHVGGVLARTRMLERITLSPEGSDLAAMRRLVRASLARGQRIFTLNYHSPSLVPGNTPYVRDARDLAVFLDRISGLLSFFCEEIGGECLSVAELHGRLLGEAATGAAPPPAPAAGARSRRAVAAAAATPPSGAAARGLIVASTFPPIHGGSAVVYDSLARFGDGRLAVLSARQDYRTGVPIAGWREADAAAPYSVHRVRLLRTRLSPDELRLDLRLRILLSDLSLRLALLWRIARIARRQRIGVLCIGELVACGWLAPIARQLGLRSVIYVHGEELTVEANYDNHGGRRRRALASADAVVAVSRFTRDTLINRFGVPPDKVVLIRNGVDPVRFTPRVRRAALAARYGLAGRRVLLTVGRLYPRKGMDQVIAALPALCQAFPDLAYLVVGDGPDRLRLLEHADRHGVGGAVIFAGEVPDAELADHYALADVFVMPNRTMPDGDTEGFGLVFLEANACGIPVIAGNAGGSVDAVQDGCNGLLVDGHDASAIAAAATRLLTDVSLREALIAGGHAVAHAARWEARAAEFLALCDRLVGASRERG